jgi:aminoglycoside phosphotransferase (APT) family kinase protein
MAESGFGTGPIEDARLLTGGTQNILLRFRLGAREFVLRRPPARPRPQSNRVMEREIQLLRGLAGGAVPHATLHAACTDTSVLGAVFYIMEPVDGFNPTVLMPAPARDDPAIRHHMGLELIDGLITLAGVDYAAAGLRDFGRLDGFLERQVGRWADELATYARFENWPGAGSLGDVTVVGDWLQSHRPTAIQPGIIHGDYHIGNVIYDNNGSLAAIVDWEMATLGDPLVDLGRLLLSWPDGGDRKPFTTRVDPLDGFPTRESLVARYASRTGRDVSSLPWFEVFACYKLGIILEGTYARSMAGLADGATGERLHQSAVALLDQARRIVERSQVTV